MRLRNIAFYGLANLAYYLGYTTFNTYALFFYTDGLGISSQMIGRSWFVFGIWNTVNDLLFGWLSDRIPERWGRRSFPILLFCVPIGISFCSIWTPPTFLLVKGEAAVSLYFLIAISVYDLLQTAVNISQGAAFPEITTQPALRANLAGMRQAMGIVGMAIGVALAPIVYSNGSWALLGGLWGVLMSAMYYLGYLGIRDSIASVSQGSAQEPSRDRSLFHVLTNRAFLIVVCFNFGIRLALACLTTVMPFYAKYVLHFSQVQLSAILATIFLSAIGTVPIWSALIKKLDLRAAGVFLMVYLAFLLMIFLVAVSLPVVLLIGLLIGPAYGGSMVILDMLFAQIVDMDFVQSGQSRAGIFSGIIGTVLRFSPALVGLLLGELLAFGGYDPTVSLQPAAVGQFLRLVMVGVPTLALIACACLLFFYPLHGARLAQQQELIARLRQK